MPNIRLLDLNLTASDEYRDEEEGALSERGPWVVQTWQPAKEGGTPRVVLQSDDFTHDVALVINGDFRDTAQKVRYAQLLADRMNRMPKE
jgi:hypothetical protein